ncbi:ABC transporter substrate-binding protein [Wenxinia marina]|uniref:Carbohydrate ABC transporter substrate-binding protein, CUT1 family n=1 Tax=Wenxinia marina DSM 24838 TaxID=1123501 RepID=A0A0D0NIV5_9RHOB|nr:sugar ABC transporter substrate-binding protein [Wenxinia marina]KIQ68235.1 carbohydrate ABC transporter substrate-binding protein, CUT1 family [Wenxinia marina DSM 24838]GGL76950.1 ABC transporter substrate-binding protein [Wenxinia marina]
MRTNLTTLLGGAVSALALSGAALAQEDVTITVWSIDGANQVGPSDTFSADFNELDNGITIDYRVLQFDEIVNETLRAYATGNAPDIVSLDNPDFALFSSRGAFLDITDMVAESDVINPDVYFEGPLNSVMWDGRLYGVGKYTDTIGVFYNADMLEEAGLEPPQTWAEFEAAARAMADPENGVYGATLSARGNEEGTFQFLPVIQMSGGSYENVNTEGAREWLTMVKGMIDDGVMSQDVLTLGQWDSTGTFNSGDAAMAISGPWEIDRMVEDADFDWGVTLLPTFEEGDERSSALGGFNLGILSTTEHPEEAFQVLEYFVSQDHRLFPEFGYLPTRGDIELPESGIPEKDAALAVFQEQLQYAQPRGPHPDWQQISKAIYDAEQAALTGQMTPDEALSQAQATIDGILN